MKNTLILYVMLLFSVAGFAQEKNENVLLQQLQQAHAPSEKIKALRALCTFFVHSNPEKSKYYAEKCLQLAQQTGDKDNEAYAYNSLGCYYHQKDDYVKATDFLLRSLTLYEELGDKKMMSVVYGNLGSLHIKRGELEEGKHELEEAIRLKTETKTTKGVANCWYNLASIAYYKKDYDEAVKYFEKAGKAAKVAGEDHIQISCLNGVAALQFKLENYDEALKGYQQALELTKKLGGENRKVISGLYHNMAMTYRKQGKYDEAIDLLYQSLAIAKEIKSNPDIKQAYSELSKYYKEQGDLSNALIAQEYYTVYKDSVINESSLRSINELQEKFKAEKRKKEIKGLQEKNGELEEKSKLRYSLLIVSVGALLLTILAIFFYLKQVRAKQARKQAELEQKALRAQMNPHFIFNSLNSIQRMYIEGKEDIANDYMADFSRLLRSILENSGKNLIRLKDELDVVQLYMGLEAIRTDHSFEYTCEIGEDIDPILVQIPPLVFQPYLENAIWHGIISKNEPGKIRLNIRKAQPGTLICQVTDNGVGFYSGKKLKAATTGNESKGMQITAERLGGQENVLIEELSTGGTCITLTIQYTL